MPINIYDDITNNQIANLGENCWELPKLIDDLENWITANYSRIPKSKYVADIGFDIRKNASGGGAILNSQIIQKISEINMDIYFSEFPGANE